MCRVVQCEKCQKPTWAGCGAHIEQVLGHVPKAQRCRCREKAAEEKPTDKPEQKRGLLGWLRR